MANKINPIECKVYRPTQEEEVDVMSAEREAYIRERYRDTLSYPIIRRQTILHKIFEYVVSWFS